MKNKIEIYGSLLLFFIGCKHSSYKEKSINAALVPPAIVSYIKREYPEAKKARYYRENQHDTVFYEVEIKYKGEELDLRFFSTGELYEIEKGVEFKKLPLATQGNINKVLSSKFEKYSIQHVEFVNPHLVTQYELMVKGRSKNIDKFYEIHFNEKGEVISFKEVFLNPIQTMF